MSHNSTPIQGQLEKALAIKGQVDKTISIKGQIAETAEPEIYQTLVDNGYFDVVWDLTRMVDSVVPSYPAGYDGVATGVTVQQVAVSWTTRLAPTFNGLSSYIDIHSTALATLFDEDAVSIYALYDNDNWANTTIEMVQEMGLNDTSDDFVFAKIFLAHRISSKYGGVSETRDTATPYAPVVPVSSAITVDTLADQMKAYQEGVQLGTTSTGIGTWTGGFNFANLGRRPYSGGSFYWDGPMFLAGVKFSSPVLSATQIAEIDTLLGA